MAECLGIYIEDNLIKYAKVSKEKNNIKVKSFGVNFYEDLNKAIDQIIEETDSQKVPICTNLSSEQYNYYDMFALLSKKDLEKAIHTEFELQCATAGENPNAYDTRFVITNSPDDEEKLKVIHITANKIEVNKKLQAFSGYKLNDIVPISLAITNLIETKPKENYLIVNIEEETTITTIINERVYAIDVLQSGSADFLKKIQKKENSYAKAYEICKDATIYTSDTKETNENDAGYLNEIMPTVFDIVENIKAIIDRTGYDINKIYLTGTATLINNLDLYFEEYLGKVEVELIKPTFLTETEDKLNIKDYIEVNTALSLALMGLGEGIEGVNFKKQKMNDKIPDWLKVEVTPDDKKRKREKKKGKPQNQWLKNDLGEKLDKTEIALLRTTGGLLLLLIVYIVFSVTLNRQMENKTQEAQESIDNTNAQIQLAQSDQTKIDSRANSYTEMIQNLQDLNDRLTDASKTRDAIPNLLNSIMYIIPENLQITSIKNTTDTHIVIEAQSNKYEQLGMFKAKLDTEMYLTNVISTSGRQEDGAIKVTIEGDLP